jgi:hypothetical protein
MSRIAARAVAAKSQSVLFFVGICGSSSSTCGRASEGVDRMRALVHHAIAGGADHHG